MRCNRIRSLPAGEKLGRVGHTPQPLRRRVPKELPAPCVAGNRRPLTVRAQVCFGELALSPTTDLGPCGSAIGRVRAQGADCWAYTLGCSSPCAHNAKAKRPSMWSLEKMWLRRVLTVLSLIPSACAISRFCRPRPTPWITSHSRRVSVTRPSGSVDTGAASCSMARPVTPRLAHADRSDNAIAQQNERPHRSLFEAAGRRAWIATLTSFLRTRRGHMRAHACCRTIRTSRILLTVQT